MSLKHHLPIPATRLALIMSPLVLLGGCVSYQFDVTTPDGGALQVMKDQDLVIPADPVRLRLRQVESRCVLIIDNPGNDPVTLDGSASTIVDPTGQSRPMATQLIAPGSYIKLILPPLHPYDPRGPRVTFGFGMFVDAQPERQATYLDIDPTGQDDWDWPGEGTVRLILSLKVKDQTSHHEITLRKIKT